MPNAIKYNVSAETLALKKGNFYIGTGDVAKGPTSSTGFYNGITPPSGGYTIYLNKANNGPSIYTVTSDAQLITLTNQIAGTSYTTVSQCLTYYDGQTDKMIFNIDYPSIVTDGLVLIWDASFIPSYPGVGTTIYDISGNGNHGTLYNGVGYSTNSGGVLTFDGSDDYVLSNTPNLASTNYTVMGAARYSGGNRGRMINARLNNWLIGQWSNSTENYYAQGWVSPVGNGPSDTNWRIYSAIGNIGADSYTSYVNNTVSTGPNSNGSAGPQGIAIGAWGQTLGNELSTGEFSFVLAYNRILTTAEMTQNYNAYKGRFGL
jgi:hypothetical protein